jgi:hypothetical protein
MIKRQMFGRTELDLLRKRIRYAPDFGIALNPSDVRSRRLTSVLIDRSRQCAVRSEAHFSTATVRARHPPRIYASIGPPADVGGLARIGAGLAQDCRQLADTG